MHQLVGILAPRWELADAGLDAFGGESVDRPRGGGATGVVAVETEDDGTSKATEDAYLQPVENP